MANTSNTCEGERGSGREKKTTSPIGTATPTPAAMNLHTSFRIFGFSHDSICVFVFIRWLPNAGRFASGLDQLLAPDSAGSRSGHTSMASLRPPRAEVVPAVFRFRRAGIVHGRASRGGRQCAGQYNAAYRRETHGTQSNRTSRLPARSEKPSKSATAHLSR